MESSQFTDSLSQFKSLEPLDTQGATCDTYRVKLYGKLHFLKRLKPEHANDIRYQEAFRKEFETGYRLEHPNLVRYISLTSDGILMEYIDGETLSQHLTTHPDYFKDKKNTDKFLRQLLDVVGYLHSHQVLHLDLKPDNILLTRIDNDVKLIDLGCCYTDTFTDTQGRTHRFAAPEQLASKEPDVRTDIYAIGKILELLPNHHIYNKVIVRCTASNPSNRYQSVEELLSDIQKAKTKKHFFISICVLLIFFIVAMLIYFLSVNKELQMSPSVKTADSIVVADSAIVADSLSMKMKNQPNESRDNHQSSPAIEEKDVSLEQLREDIQKTILPKFNQTVGALPDSVMPGSSEWADACKAFEPMITESLKEIIIAHQKIPMTTVAKEFNDYVQSLLTLKMNQAKDPQ
ncbi:MAG: serine/threonine protein kinase [Prevotella sp.]|nr:serine/threonine protein kinase [Prevotella sp.]